MPALTGQLKAHAAQSDFEDAWRRQRKTAADILQRLEHQEGVILADQVGMGKTYVALAVAVSQILSTAESGQVLILAPAAVAQKWVDEWAKFRDNLLTADHGVRCVASPLRSGEELFAALDDPPETRHHVLVATHTALTSTLKDSFIQLALLHMATRRRPDRADARAAIARWSEGQAGLLRDARFQAKSVARLLEISPATWRKEWMALTGESLPDDPVPAAVVHAMEELNLDPLRVVIASLPRRSSSGIQRRLKEARSQLSDATQDVWRAVLSSTQLALPLLIVDEAHRLKNDNTRISQLFAPRQPGQDSGALTDIFDRMLLLTATPFELGHSELIRVLSRLSAVRARPAGVDEPLSSRLERLGEVLTSAQATAISLDHAWAPLTLEDRITLETWSPSVPPPADSGARVDTAWRAASYAASSRRKSHAALRPWVIRHERPRRRTYLPGADILPSAPPGTGAGLDIATDMLLPFLLAARAQAMASEDARGVTRPHFAYGIASSFEAFRRLGSAKVVRDSDLAVDESTPTDPGNTNRPPIGAAAWYHREIDGLLVEGGLDRADHPKLKATVDRATRLWLAGYKCLVFCWYIATGEAVEAAMQRRVESLVWGRVSAALELSGGIEESQAELAKLSERVLRRDSRSYEEIRGRLEQFFTRSIADADRMTRPALISSLGEIAIRNLRTPAYLVRYAPLSAVMSHDDLWAGLEGRNPARVCLLDRWRRFALRLSAEGDEEQDRVIIALLGESATGEQISGAVEASRRGANLNTVRRAHGGTKRDTRERLTALFNTPFAPDILVASSVMGEGIDLHRECRHVIHHDLDWNPSVLEQRTGRLDRIGALAENDGANIEIFEPYLAGTHDEKMYKVVKDRAGWFDIVMGRAAGADERDTDVEETRAPLSKTIAAALTMHLES